jgi:hypothetical protein
MHAKTFLIPIAALIFQTETGLTAKALRKNLTADDADSTDLHGSKKP